MGAQRLDDWVSRQADEAIEAARRFDTTIVCASGLSPSGPIHLGNLREVMTPHLVADEIQRRGIECEHIISWDDYDRFRRVPRLEGMDPSWERHIGKPLTAVPAPPGSPHDSWAAHFRAECEASLAALGIGYRGISQTEQYTSGAYTEQILHAMRERAHIDAVLGRYRTLARAAQVDEGLDADHAAAAAVALEGSGAAGEDDGGAGGEYYPYRPYCTVCGTDRTAVTGYDDETTELSYVCACGHAETVVLREFHHGKLVWKVDWPMRWGYERVIFEPSGVDHQSPGSSYVVGKDLAPIFGWHRPLGPMYAFVGIKGMAKMSSSRGGVPVPAQALRYMEAPLLRWLYARRRPNQSFDIALDADIERMYDEWDALVRKVDAGAGQAGDVAAHARSVATAAAGRLPLASRSIPYRTLTSVLDITTGDEQQAARILSTIDPDRPVTDLDELRPRLDCAEHWVAEQLPAEDRIVVHAAPDAARLAGLAGSEAAGLRMLLDGAAGELPPIEEAWSLDGLTHQVYGVPKVQHGVPAGQKVKGDRALSGAQREFFRLVYQLLIGRDTGPRLPTLLLAVGPERTRALLTPVSAVSAGSPGTP